MKKTALILLLAATSLHAAEEDPTEKFREALKNTMLKLRDAQNQVATAQAAQYAAEAKSAAAERVAQRAASGGSTPLVQVGTFSSSSAGGATPKRMG